MCTLAIDISWNYLELETTGSYFWICLYEVKEFEQLVGPESESAKELHDIIALYLKPQALRWLKNKINK